MGVMMAVILFAVAVVMANRQEAIADDYFVSDDTKLVLTMDAETAGFVEGEYEPPYTHIVYYYSEDDITDVKVYFAYDDAEAAIQAYNNIDLADANWMASMGRNGRYLVFETKRAKYEGLSVSEVRSNINSARAAGAVL